MIVPNGHQRQELKNNHVLSSTVRQIVKIRNNESSYVHATVLVLSLMYILYSQMCFNRFSSPNICHICNIGTVSV